MTRSNPPRSPTAKVITKLRTIAETGEILNCSRRTVRRLIESGELRAHRIRGLIRISDADIAAYLAEN
jgi:excisionase family DNA binding protein